VNDELWVRVERALDLVLERERSQWPAAVQQACGGDPEVRREVEALLARYTRAERAFRTAPEGVAAALVAEALIRHEAMRGVGIPNDRLERLRNALAQRYRIEREVGVGGMATVYLAEDLKHERRVAIKVLRPELAAALGPDRFLREIKLTARLNHPHILPLLDSGETNGLLYYVMPFVEGESLRDRLQRETRLDVADALNITRAAASALDYAHRNGIVHRDIKPENILLHEGEAMVADFGIAVALRAAGGERLTGTGIAIGTPAYMSPEQGRGEHAIDARSDLYSLACVVYEMLAGQPPFVGPSLEAIIAQRHADPVPHLSAVWPAHDRMDKTLSRALSAAPDERFDSVGAFVRAFEVAASTPDEDRPSVRALLRLARRPTVALTGVALILGLVATVVLPIRTRLARIDARELIPEIRRLADAGRYAGAYELAARVERSLGADPTLAELWPRVADDLSITSEPAGAQVYLQHFSADGADAPRGSTLVGVTPLEELRVARGDYRVVFVRAGFAPVERMASSAKQRAELFAPERPVEVHAVLTPRDSLPDGMVFVPGGDYALANPDLTIGLAARLQDYYIDRYEVTNEQFSTFVRDGGYHSPRFWTHPFLENGAKRSREDAFRRLRDRTGLPGPRSWVKQEFPSGQERHPVTDIGWYEAAAYCAWAGKRLPTVFEWEKAARNGERAKIGVMMPWGHMSPPETGAQRANFSSSGAVPVDAYPFGISPYGAYGMAGNVKEWTLNEIGGGRGVTGGSFEDPMYLYSVYAGLPPLHASGSLGFRCARTASGTGDQGSGRIDIDLRTPEYRPVDERTFRTFLTHYRHDRRPLNARIVETHETPDWTRETIQFAGLGSDTVIAYLFIPHQAAAPYQTMVLLPGSNVFFADRVEDQVVWLLGPNILYGRAVMAVVLKGMVHREFGPGWESPDPASVRFRDLMVLHARELSLGIDYLETRGDIDMTRLAYVALSWGSGSRLVLAGTDDRYRSIVLIGGGIDERVQPTLPEASNINFAPYLEPPKLLLNGRFDEEHPWYTRALPLWNLLREPKKLVLVEEAGHVPPVEARAPAINQWLDETLGLVRRD
jgi:formylglycine-generating enzyme required for sulfatase activity